MLSRLLPLTLIFGLTGLGFSQDTFPTRMIEFLKKGQHIGISTRVETGSTLIVFNDEMDMQIHRDSEKMSVEELRQKYNRIEQQAIEIIKSHVSESESNGSQTPRVDIGRVAPVRYARILNVGADYVLLEYENGHRTAYSSGRIGSLVWDDGKPNLYIATASEDSETDRTKRLR